MSGHTRGPWVRDGLSIYAFMHAGWKRGEEELKNRFYLRIYGDRECPEEEIEANARLIAAAPMLLEALTSLLPFVVTEVLEHCDGNKCREQWCAGCMGEEEAESAVEKSRLLYHKARAAIAAATGETK